MGEDKKEETCLAPARWKKANDGDFLNVRMNEHDFALIKKAADKLWPHAVMSNSGVLLGLAKMAANQILEKKQR